MYSRSNPSMFLIAGVLLFASAAFGAERPIPADEQQRLLERFGEDGIDVNGDGTLSGEEVRAFIHEQFGDVVGPPDRRGGPRGRRPGRGQDPIGDALRTLERIDHAMAKQASVAGDSEAANALAEDKGVLQPERAERMHSRVINHLMKLAPEADANADGTLDDVELADLRETRRERVSAFLLERHPEADVDEDGELSAEEMEAFQAARKAERIERVLERHPEADLDGDGTLSAEEIEALREEFGPPHRGFRERGPRPRFDQAADEKAEE